MKFVSALLFGMAAASSYKQARQAANPVAGVFTILSPMVEDLDSKIKAYTGGPGEDVLSQSKKIVAAVQQAVGTVSGVGQLDISAASGLVEPVQSFTKVLQTTIDDLLARKQTAVSNGLGKKVYDNLVEQKAGATKLAEAIKSKMPSSLTATATELSDAILAAINKGITGFQDQANASGAGAGAGAGSAASSPSSGSSTSASGSAGGAGAGMSLSPAGSSTSLSGSGAGAGMSSSSGMSSMGASSGSAAGGASAPMAQTTSAPGAGSGPAVFTGAGASFKPASVFGLVAVAAAVFAF